MLVERMETALNEQVNKELFSAYLYQAMSAYFEKLGFKGFANWTAIQAKEEMTHAMKFYAYIVERGGTIILKTIDAPQSEWKNVIDTFENILKHEYKISASINELVNIAIEEKDHASNNFLQWFVSEQVEEEANVDEILQQLKFIGDNGAQLFMLDRELKQRVFVDATTQA